MTDPFAVAAGHDLTAETAADVLRAGGSAVDAAIAGALTACVAEPVLASLFGGGFLMVREASGRVRLLDFFVQTPRRRAPDADVDLRAIEANFGEATQVFHIGAGSIAAPGVARGLAEAHAHYGVIPFDDLAAPAIRAAKEGIALTPFQAGALEIVTAIYAAAPETRALFGDGETLLKAGETFRNARLADVMEVFVAEGDRFMQEGEAAQSLLSLDGGHLTPADLRDYRAIWREPLEEARATRSGPARIHLNPPPALGGALIAFALRLIEPGDRPVDIARAFEATSRARLEADLN
ncbi:MAG: gamma-glutamyltransferase [Pseudomonadota bacterium]